MKLFIQIPCLNEEKTLHRVINSLPKKIEGIDEIYTLIINDGSTDDTLNTAKKLGVNYIINNGKNLGLAKSYSRGLEASLFLGADIIVNTDGDNQYFAGDIAKLVEPILQNNADIVIGCRDIEGSKEFSSFKKILQKLGSSIVSRVSGTEIPDTTSGFRAINRKAAITFSVMNTFSYTLETLIQAGRTGMNITWIPIRVNPKLRESRLFKSIPDFVSKQILIIFSVYLFYAPMRFFSWIASFFFVLSIINASRILYYLYFVGIAELKFKTGSGILLLFCATATILFLVAGLLGSVLSGLRILIVDLRSRIRNIEFSQEIPPFDIELIKN